MYVAANPALGKMQGLKLVPTSHNFTPGSSLWDVYCVNPAIHSGLLRLHQLLQHVSVSVSFAGAYALQQAHAAHTPTADADCCECCDWSLCVGLQSVAQQVAKLQAGVATFQRNVDEYREAALKVRWLSKGLLQLLRLISVQCMQHNVVSVCG